MLPDSAAARQQLAATSAGDVHRPRQRSVQHDQHAARNQVREDDAQPEVGAEVEVHVLLDDRRVVHVAAVHLHTCTGEASIHTCTGDQVIVIIVVILFAQ